MISRDEIFSLSGKHRIEPGVIEKDYVLSKILFGLSTIPEFQERFVFKGGTALKKIYFHDWRYSEDLDFTLTGYLNKDRIRQIAEQACKAASDRFGLELRVTTPSEVTSRDSGKVISTGLRVMYNGPLMKTSGFKNQVNLHLSFDEVLVSPPRLAEIPKVYSDDVPFALLVYPLEELIGEKLRTVLERGKARDYYDIWLLLKGYEYRFDIPLTRDTFQKKCNYKKVTGRSLDDFFRAERLEAARSFWEVALAHQVDGLPPFDTVINETKNLLSKILGSIL